MRLTLSLLLFGATLTLATDERVRFDTPGSGAAHRNVRVRALPGANLFLRQSTCPSGYKTCGTGCALIASECCVSSGGDGSCPSGYYCDGTGLEAGCCRDGRTCSGLSGECTDSSKECGGECIPESETCDVGSSGSSGSGVSSSSTRTSSGSTPTTSSGTGSVGGGSVSSCSALEEECGTGCMPIGATCCNDSGQGDYCRIGYSCVGTSQCRFGSGSSGSGGSSGSEASSSSSRTTSTRAPVATVSDTAGGGSTSSNVAPSTPNLTAGGGNDNTSGGSSVANLPGLALSGTALLVGLIAVWL